MHDWSSGLGAGLQSQLHRFDSCIVLMTYYKFLHKPSGLYFRESKGYPSYAFSSNLDKEGQSYYLGGGGVNMWYLTTCAGTRSFFTSDITEKIDYIAEDWEVVLFEE